MVREPEVVLRLLVIAKTALVAHYIGHHLAICIHIIFPLFIIQSMPRQIILHHVFYNILMFFVQTSNSILSCYLKVKEATTFALKTMKLPHYFEGREVTNHRIF